MHHLLVAALWLPAQPPDAAAVALQHAPVIFQEVHDPLKDLYSAFDFDGNWDGVDNADNMECWANSAGCVAPACANQGCPLVATVYWSVQQTPTHWFIQYQPYHPLDFKLTNGHEHDTESILVVVRRDGALGTLEAMEVRFHLEWFAYRGVAGVSAGAGQVRGDVKVEAGTGRSLVYSQMVGHGLCGGFSPPNRLFPDLQLTCNHNETPHIDKTGVIYRPDRTPGMPVVVTDQAVEAGYVLAPLDTTIWPRIHDVGAGTPFADTLDYAGSRCNQFTCPVGIGRKYRGDRGSSPGAAWTQDPGAGVSAEGEQFFDPAWTLFRRLGFPEPFSLEYCWNPYLGVTSGCATDAGPADATLPHDAAVPVDAAVPADAATAADAAVVTDGGGITVDGGTTPPPDAGRSHPPPGETCSCRAAGINGFPAALIVLAGAYVVRARRANRSS